MNPRPRSTFGGIVAACLPAAALAASVLWAGAVSANPETPPGVVRALVENPALSHLVGLGADPAVRARLPGLTLLAPVAGPWGLPRDPAALSAWLDRHSLPGVWTLSDLAKQAKSDGAGRAFVSPDPGGSMVLASDTAPGGFVVVDGNGNTSAVLASVPVSGGAVLLLDRPLGVLSEPTPPPAGGAFVALP